MQATTSATERLSHEEPIRLMRGLRELHVAISEDGGPAAGGSSPVEPSAIAMIFRLADLGPARLSALASALCVDLSTVSRQVPALERRGWVLREKDPADQRAAILELTEEGRTALREIRAARAQLLGRLLPGWSAAELAAFADQLARFNDDVSGNRSVVLESAQGARR